MKSIEEITEHTLVIKKSEFICTLIPLNDEEKINEIIDYYKEKYKNKIKIVLKITIQNE